MPDDKLPTAEQILNIEAEHSPFAATGPKRLAQRPPASNLSNQWRALGKAIRVREHPADCVCGRCESGAALIAAADAYDELRELLATAQDDLREVLSACESADAITDSRMRYVEAQISRGQIKDLTEHLAAIDAALKVTP